MSLKGESTEGTRTGADASASKTADTDERSTQEAPDLGPDKAKMISIPRAAELAGIPQRRFRRIVRQKESGLRCIQINRHLYVMLKEFDLWMKSSTLK